MGLVRTGCEDPSEAPPYTIDDRVKLSGVRQSKISKCHEGVYGS